MMKGRAFHKMAAVAGLSIPAANALYARSLREEKSNIHLLIWNYIMIFGEDQLMRFHWSHRGYWGW